MMTAVSPSMGVGVIVGDGVIVGVNVLVSVGRDVGDDVAAAVADGVEVELGGRVAKTGGSCVEAACGDKVAVPVVTGGRTNAPVDGEDDASKSGVEVEVALATAGSVASSKPSSGSGDPAGSRSAGSSVGAEGEERESSGTPARKNPIASKMKAKAYPVSGLVRGIMAGSLRPALAPNRGD
jgi:hypothetical protein